MSQEGGSGFQDHFSQIAAGYAAHRPSYPTAVADLLAGLAPRHDLAWDSGCGSGQLSVLLAGRFARVIATDASAEQIAQGQLHPRVEYRCAPAEASGLPDAVVDLAVAAQAAHWFDLPAYYAEVRRVARPAAIVALLTYGMIRLGADLDPLIERFYHEVLGNYWPAGRRYVEDGYRSLPFPYEAIPVPALEMREYWALAAVLGYLDTWSATWALERAEGRGPIEAFRRDLARMWGPAGSVRSVHWDLTVRAGRL